LGQILVGTVNSERQLILVGTKLTLVGTNSGRDKTNSKLGQNKLQSTKLTRQQNLLVETKLAGWAKSINSAGDNSCQCARSNVMSFPTCVRSSSVQGAM
jgi:hypothetical protein